VEFFEPENPAALAAAIIRLYEDPARCARLSAQANRVAVKLSARWSENYLEAIAPEKDSTEKGSAEKELYGKNGSAPGAGGEPGRPSR
jgi:hypothetical protein